MTTAAFNRIRITMAIAVGIVVVMTFCLVLSPAARAGDEDTAAVEDWPQFQRDAVNSGTTTAAAPVAAPVEAWGAFTHYRSTHGIDVTPVAAGGRVFVIDVDGCAWAFDAADGEAVWSTQLKNDTRFKLATPAWDDGRVFFATDSGYIYALDDASGGVLWSGKLTEGSYQEAELNTQITCDADKVYVGSWEGKYYCLDAAGNGTLPRVDWTYQVADTRYDWYSGAAVIGDYVLFGNTDGLLTCLDKTSGSPVDYCDPGADYGIDAGSICSAVSTDTAQDRVYLTSKNGYLFAIGFDAATGLFDTGSGWYRDIDDYATSTPVYHDGRVYVCSGGSFYGQEGGVYCFEAADGSPVWFNDLGVSYGSQASPAVSVLDEDLYIYVSTGAPQAAVACLDAAGNLLWEHVPSYTEYALQGVSVYDGRVYFANDAGYLYALATPAVWDLNADGRINVLDMILVGKRFGETGSPGWIDEDANGDGVINVLDMIVVGNHFGD